MNFKNKILRAIKSWLISLENYIEANIDYDHQPEGIDLSKYDVYYSGERIVYSEKIWFTDEELKMISRMAGKHEKLRNNNRTQ